MYDILRKQSVGLDLLIKSFVIIVLFNVPFLIHAMNQYGLGLRLIDKTQDEFLNNAFGWAYSWVFISVGLFYFLFNKESFPKLRYKKKVSLFLLVFLLVGIYIVIRSLYMTAILLLIVGFILAVVIGRLKSLFVPLIFVIFGLFALVYLIATYGIDLPFLNDEHNMLLSRVDEVSLILQGNIDSAADFGSRNELFNNSLKTFKDNFLFGINHEISDFGNYKEVIIGGHSEWVDNLAKYGLFSLLLVFFLIKSVLVSKPRLWCVYIILFLLGFFNPSLQFPMIFTVFLMMPIIFRYQLENKQFFFL